MANDTSPTKPSSPAELFSVFNALALQGFGGVLPVAQRALVEQHRWLTREQFLELLSLAQVLPGPNIVNLALIFGDRCFGRRGAAAAMGGVLLVPLMLVLLLAWLAQRGQQLPWLSGVLNGALRGMGVVAAGLVLATAVKLSSGLRTHVMGWPACALCVALAALGIGWLRWPLVGVVLSLGAFSIALVWWRLKP
jgi:chromate transporter